MTHKCVRCSREYQDNDTSILRGCKCGSIFFVYMKSTEDVSKVEKIESELKQKKTTLEKEIQRQIEEVKKASKDKREIEEVKFGIETIRVPREGVYYINIDALMKRHPVIILERGRVYFIHLPSVFERV